MLESLDSEGGGCSYMPEICVLNPPRPMHPVWRYHIIVGLSRLLASLVMYYLFFVELLIRDTQDQAW